MTMKKLTFALAVAGMVTSVAATAEVPLNLLGDPATPEQAQRTIEISPATKYVNVTGGEVVRFVVNGTSFVWNFDSLAVDAVELNRVAPPAALDHRVTAYVARNPLYPD
jgi:hypothetical protein